ncbi:glycosyltransferase family 4 protein [Stieleria sp. JC731]|uniref:glycosyltransferase family 4 protein n=1 Tax=Pirellulaceae TaxID=2691357 RepID=UPI001E2BE02B|nr:glycosyltransferase family 4 protein [Stieleria sp. JC731]MCC9601245.1 glycosyltransferase family 4 protein [Stieleria sp. JC731]
MEKPTQHRRRIVFLNRSYWPDIEATGQLLTDLCKGLASQYDVHVVCGQPNFPEPNSRFMRSGVEVRSGVTLHRLNHRQANKKNPFSRIASMISFYRAVDRYLKQSRLAADIVISETDPFMLPLAGARHAQRIGAQHCVYLQDIYPDVAVAIGKLRLPYSAELIRNRLRQSYVQASKIIVLGRCMRRRLIGPTWNVPTEKIELLSNWADCTSLQPVEHINNPFRRRHNLADDFIVMHSGNMGLTQRLDVLIEATQDPSWPSHAKLLLVGNGASRDRLLERAKQVDPGGYRIRFAAYQPREKLRESLSAADVHIVSMHEKVAGCLCPSKLYGIMSVGRPIIAVADSETDLCQTVIERDLGWCVQPGSPKLLAQAVAMAEAQANGSVEQISISLEQQSRLRKIARTEFDRPVIIERFAQLLGNILIDKTSDEVHSPSTTVPAPLGSKFKTTAAIPTTNTLPTTK